MSMPMTRRKRARKACNPCQKRKRKCDGEYPCGTCTTYEYTCSYSAAAATAEDIAGTTRGAVYAPTPDKRVNLEGGCSTANRAGATLRSSGSPSQAERSPREADGGSTLEAGASTATTTPVGIFDHHRSRYAGASAAMAFPHILSGALGSSSPSKIQSLAYNFGIRPEEASSAHALLGTLISAADLDFFSGVYFSALAPVIDLLDPRIFAQRCRDYYYGPASTMIAFGAVAAGVAALGSFLSSNRHPREAELVQYAKAILDDPASMRMLDIDHIVAWAMRVVYLRATSRPNNAWIASCTALHLCEAVGLHEEENIKKMASVAGAALVGHDLDRLRRIFWISWAGHNLLSYEYDRSAVRFRAVTCQAIIPTAGSVADQFVQIAQIIPAPNSPFRLECQPPTPRDELFERMKALDKLQFTHPFLVVTKAELAFCFYRRIYQLKMGISDDIIKIVIDCGNAAVDVAQQLANQGHLFWNVIGSVFQYTCVLLAIDTPATSIQIAAAFKGLENVVKAADTGPTREALSMARHLLSLHTAKKRKELAQLEAVEAGYQFCQMQPNSEANNAVPDTGWGVIGWGIDWDQLLIEPYVSMFGPDV
ncbi:C6 zinc finger domain protein [Mariannaea sp. PMI_226]|nr:C6 zinc finger domain protein [Mariannaea sp. PMI_226]